MCHILHHLLDLQLRHRVESIIAFSNHYVSELQTDQLRRYIEIKQEDLPAAVAAKKTREFRCSPLEQMKSILSFKDLDEENSDSCLCREDLREKLFNLHNRLMARVKVVQEEESEDSSTDSGISVDGEEKKSWSKKLINIVKSVKSIGQKVSNILYSNIITCLQRFQIIVN